MRYLSSVRALSTVVFSAAIICKLLMPAKAQAIEQDAVVVKQSVTAPSAQRLTADTREVTAAGVAAFAPLPADRHARVDALFARWDSTATPGCAIGISRDGLSDYVRGYGMANLETGSTITPDTVFHVASISKQFTAFAIGLLAQEGKLSLQDDVRKYVPELPDFGRTVTIDHLVHHTSGLREEGHLLWLSGWRAQDLHTEADMLRIASKQRALNFAPGAEPVYSNVNYTLLSIIVKRVSGKSLRLFAAERIFEPLGMTRTMFQDDHTEIVFGRASAYTPRATGGWRVDVPHYDFNGSTSLQTTVGDLLKWEQNLVDARVGGRALVDAMLTSGRLSNGEATGYGGGLRIGQYRGLRTIAHDGADAGYRADKVSFPDQRLAIAVLCNSAAIVPTALTRGIADIYLGDRLGPAMPPATTVSQTELAALAGVYWSDTFQSMVRLDLKDGALQAVGSSAPLVPTGRGVFHAPSSTNAAITEEWRFTTPASAAASATGARVEAATELRLFDIWPVPRLFRRLTDPVPTAAALTAFAGDYRSSETDMTYTVQVEGGKLAMRWGRSGAFTLEPIGGDHFIDGAWSVTFTRRASGEIDGLAISSRRVRRLRAERLPAAASAAQSRTR